MNADIKADAILDCVGLYCPMPIIQTTEHIAGLEVGQVLEVVADDKGIVTDMPAWCKGTGHEYLGMQKQGGEYHVFVRKKHG